MKLKNDAMGADGKRAQNHRHGGDLHHLDHHPPPPSSSSRLDIDLLEFGFHQLAMPHT